MIPEEYNGFLLFPDGDNENFILLEFSQGKIIETFFVAAKDKNEALQKSHEILKNSEIYIEYVEEEEKYPSEEDMEKIINQMR